MSEEKAPYGAQRDRKAQEVTLDEVYQECLDSLGFVVFVGVLSRNQRDVAGNNIINFRYIRQNFSYEDTKKAIAEFKNQFAMDVMSGDGHGI